jgi:tetratricopeptide (TPR) repeat protein
MATIGIMVLLVLTVGLTIRQGQVKKHKIAAVVMTGLPKEQATGMQKELGEAFEYKSYLDKGDELVGQGRIDNAIKEYETAFSLAKISGAKGLAIYAISNAYEKKRDYRNALKYVIIDRDKYVNSWAKGPIVERAIYLEYALKGEYDLAVEHAKKALEEDAKLPNAPKGGSKNYVERLNNLKAAKDYILSLKKQQ